MQAKKNHLKLFDNLICKNPNYNNFLATEVCKSSNDLLLVKFANSFFSYLPVDYIAKDKDEIFINFAKEAYDFFKNRQKGQIKIEVLSGESGKAKPFLSLKLINDDKPFIVDSLKCLFARLSIVPKFIFHPVISVNRNADGNLTQIDSDGAKESLVCVIFQVTKDDMFIEHLKHQVINVLEKVSITYKFWPEFLAKVDSVSKEISGESHNFLQWIKADNFTFLGYVEYKDGKITNSIGDNDICQGAEGAYNLEDNNSLMTIGQVNKLSPIHKSTFMDYVKVKVNDKTYIFLGLYGSAIYYQSINNIPILRKKLHTLLDNSGFVAGGYNAKKLRAVVEALPREILFNIDDSQLECMSMHVLSATATKSLKLFIHPDDSAEFINLLIFLPRERLTPDVHYNINSYLAEKFKTNLLTDYITEIENNFSYLYVTLSIGNVDLLDLNMKDIENDIDNLSAHWQDALSKQLFKKYSETEVDSFIEYADIFPKSYQYQFDSAAAIVDISYIKQLSPAQNNLFNLELLTDGYYRLKIYTSFKQNLSDLLPLIENLGFKAIDEQMFELTKGANNFWIYQFNIMAEHQSSDSIEYVKQNVEDALLRMSSGVLPIDSICKLVVLAGFNWRKIMIIKGLTGYLQQTDFSYGKGYVKQTLIRHYEFAALLMQLFGFRFDPANLSKIEEQKVLGLLEQYLGNVQSSAEDKVLRSLLYIVLAITRTNCYQTQSDGLVKNYISFKFDSSKVPNLPRPIPYAEIFVYSNEFEGIHLRGGRVSRGGLRWSDREEDYRTEVLGLMKAQMTKNAVIVPVGSKGGFVVNVSSAAMDRSAYMAKVVECYQNFLRGLLDLTDNIVDGKIISPKQVVMIDEPDPYLVVAADKGTATFSDYANQISAEYGFWLGDAFASGGSAGYDHKKMAITARGAWISVSNHFAALGKNVQKDPITVLGIGDMSGDVFGNGMLLSSSIKLVAAFNHIHIFLDPNPDPTVSFKERKRLFDLPGSKWSDYDSKLISKGGGVFSRSDKRIALTPEVQSLLGVNIKEVEPEQLINLLLKSKVDLLWNGGIGTYIKASDESHLEIGDKSNDNLRCNAKDVGAKVIGEGGNLGVSQRGRIEYSKNGGCINTDFIDNSAGVDCSDHEVNIKIAFGSAVASGRLAIKDRNELLSKMTSDVADLVLEDNFKQTQAITITEKSNAYNVEMFAKFISHLESKSLLDRGVECLPTDAELARRSAAGEKMTRPELAVLLSYGKMMVYNDLFTSKLADDKYFEPLLMSYFPDSMQQNFKEEILSHHLRREIILTIITNKMINQLGGPIINSIQSDTGAMLCDIVRSYVIVCDIFKLDHIWQKVEKDSSNFSNDLQIEMFTELGKVMRRGISWFIRNLSHPIEISESVKYYSASSQILCKMIGSLLLGDAKLKRESKLERYKQNNVNPSLAEDIANLDSLISVFDIIFVAGEAKVEVTEIARLYFEVSDRFNIDWLRKACEKQINDSYWNKLSIQALKDDLYDKQRRLLQKIVTSNSGMEVSKWYDKHEKYALDFTNFVEDLKSQENIDLNMMILANKKFEMFLRKV